MEADTGTAAGFVYEESGNLIGWPFTFSPRWRKNLVDQSIICSFEWVDELDALQDEPILHDHGSMNFASNTAPVPSTMPSNVAAIQRITGCRTQHWPRRWMAKRALLRRWSGYAFAPLPMKVTAKTPTTLSTAKLQRLLINGARTKPPPII